MDSVLPEFGGQDLWDLRSKFSRRLVHQLSIKLLHSFLHNIPGHCFEKSKDGGNYYDFLLTLGDVISCRWHWGCLWYCPGALHSPLNHSHTCLRYPGRGGVPSWQSWKIFLIKLKVYFSLLEKINLKNNDENLSTMY